MNRVQIGAKLPNNETVRLPSKLKQFVQGIESLGFDHLSIDDHVATSSADKFAPNPGGFTTVRAEHELFTTLAYLAGVTSTLRFRAGVLILPQRQTVLVARQAAEVDVFSEGRLTLGVGLGWNSFEFDALGESFGRRSRRFEPQIGLLRRLWTEDYVSCDDEWHQLDQTGILPRPVQQPIPIWIGAHADSAIRRAARIADGFMVLSRIGHGAERQVELIRTERDRIGLASSEFGIEGWIDLDVHAESSWRAQADAWVALGARQITLLTPAAPLISIEDHLELLQRGLSVVAATRD